MKIAIMADTNSGITQQMADELGIFVIPMPVILENETYYEGQNITTEKFYQLLPNVSSFSTSQPSPGNVLDMWEKILSSGYDEIVYIPMSSALSNSCETAISLAQDFDGKVQVADNHRVSITLYQSVITAKKLADEGKSAIEIKQYLEKTAYESSIYLAVDTLDYLKKGGRITPAAAMLGSVLNIKPVLSILGEKINPYSKVRGMKKAQKCMIEALQNDITTRLPNEDIDNLKIGCAGANLSQIEIEYWTNLVKETFPTATIYYHELSASIACHTGPGAIGIGICFC